MKNVLRKLAPLCVFASLGFSSQVSASLMMESYNSGVATPEIIGGYNMVDIDGSSLGFTDLNGDSVAMGTGTADTTGWWVNGESSDNDIYTTTLHLIKVTLPVNTVAVSFNVGASFWGQGWLTAEELNSNGTAGSGLSAQYFGLNPNNTPGFGIYADNTNGSCSQITSVTIDPYLIWGFGNFSISQDACGTVPEPSTIALFAAGLFGLGYARRRQQA